MDGPVLLGAGGGGVVSDRPTPPRRYLDEPDQAAYEAGWAQMLDHDSSAFLERFSDLYDEQLTAALFGASDALCELAEQRQDAIRFAADLDGDDTA
jgi:hypothetical protein